MIYVFSMRPMRPMQPFLQRDNEQQWWELDLDLNAELYRADCVFYDKISQQYDNNKSRCAWVGSKSQ